MIKKTPNNKARTAEVTSSAPKAHMHDIGGNATERLRHEIEKYAVELPEGTHLLVKEYPKTSHLADIAITYLKVVLDGILVTALVEESDVPALLADVDVDVEVKQGDTGTSQVRPYEYLPVVVWGKNTGKWYVHSPVDIFLRAQHCSGQHAIDSFECCNIGRPGSTPRKGDKQFWSEAECKPEDLPKAILTAFLHGEINPEYRERAAEVEKDAHAQKEKNLRMAAKLPKPKPKPIY